MSKKALGLDLGKITLGISYSDSLEIVHPLMTLRFKSNQYRETFSQIKKICDENEIDEIALGYPLHLNGEPSERSKICLEFKEALEQLYPNLHVHLVDERLTSVEAHRYLNNMNVSHQIRKKVVDQMAAIEILDTYLRRRKNENGK